jgi:small-conductance mechanosensitive channel
MLQDGPSPDVWLQLLERLVAVDECQPIAMRSVAQQLAEQRALTGCQQRKIAGLQEQLSAQQQTAAEQIAGLQGQLQELRATLQQLLPSHRHG